MGPGPRAPMVATPLIMSWYLCPVTTHSWWRHQMKNFSALLAICVGNSPVTGEFTAQRPVTRSFDVFFDLRLNKRWACWVNNGEADDFRHYRAHYDVIVMRLTNDDLSLSIGLRKFGLQTTLGVILITKITKFSPKFEYVACQMSVILCKPPFVKQRHMPYDVA